MRIQTSLVTAFAASLSLVACSGGSGGEGTSYEEQLNCYTVLMGVNAANRGSGEELPGATNALLLMKGVEMEGGEKGAQVPQDLHASSNRIQDIMAMKGVPASAAEFERLEAEAETCSATFKS